MTYTFRNIETGECVEIEMPMKNYKHYQGVSGDEDCWEQVYETPQISMRNSTSAKVDPFSQKEFVDRTGKMKGNVGDMLDYSKELSEKREAAHGKEDPVKRKHFQKYEKLTGKKHLQDKKKVYENKHVKISLD